MRNPTIYLASLLCVLSSHVASAQVRIKDIVTIQGVRPNHLVGYGLVIGLNGTGDSLRNAPFTQQSMQSMLDRMGVNIRGSQARTKNIAAVIVTAELPPYASKGSRIDVTVASLGDATSLVGGSLIMTPLSGANDAIYAVAQGQLTVGAIAASGRSETVTKGVPTSGRVPAGALIERDVPSPLGTQSELTLELNNPDFRTAVAVADAINQLSKSNYKEAVATADGARAIRLRRPRSVSPTRFMAELGALTIVPDIPARVVIDERTGTIVIGRDVAIQPVAVAHGDVTVRVTETPRVSQPAPFSKGETKVLSDTTIGIDQSGGALHHLNGPTLHSIVTGLNRIGLKPTGIIAVLQAIKSAGALNAELIVQ